MLMGESFNYQQVARTPWVAQIWSSLNFDSQHMKRTSKEGKNIGLEHHYGMDLIQNLYVYLLYLQQLAVRKWSAQRRTRTKNISSSTKRPRDRAFEYSRGQSKATNLGGVTKVFLVTAWHIRNEAGARRGSNDTKIIAFGRADRPEMGILCCRRGKILAEPLIYSHGFRIVRNRFLLKSTI